jgi:hypothetical protein
VQYLTCGAHPTKKRDRMRKGKLILPQKFLPKILSCFISILLQ